MLMFLFFFVPASLYALADLVPAIKAGERKAPLVYIAVMAAALALWVCLVWNVPLKPPSDYVVPFLKSLFPPLD
jgi:hypothetical protein